MPDILIVIAGSLLLVIGLLGCILPVIPGPPLSFAGLLLLRFTHFVEPARVETFDHLLWIMGGAAIVVTVLDYVVPVWGTRRFGGSKAGTWGAAAGVVVGLFFAPAGLIIGPFAGAFIAELISGKNQHESLRAGFGSFLGVLSGVVLKLIVSVIITWYFVKEIIVTYG
ncbi:MAG TPA: DUF456 domain-containing protein [Bacteroidales bacterium]|nr:DUF456 domain-containing protein [Bacteroidales bacterium]